MRKALVCGGGGFIGSHLVKKLKEEGCWVRAVYLRDGSFCRYVIDQHFDEIFQRTPLPGFSKELRHGSPNCPLS